MNGRFESEALSWKGFDLALIKLKRPFRKPKNRGGTGM